MSKSDGESAGDSVIIVKTREIRASPDRVWETLVDWEKERKYWTNVRGIKVLKSDGTTIEREATVGPRGFAQKTRQTVVLDPKKSIRVSFEGGQINGGRDIVLVPTAGNGTRVDVAWDLRLDGVPGFVEGIVRNQISKVTEDALRKIAETSERDGAQAT